MSEPLTFPYPTTGATRSPGQGCSTCVHTKYCQAFYWYYRDAQFPSVTGKSDSGVDSHLGTSCNSWSNDESSRLHPSSEGDLAYHERLAETEGILREQFRNGVTAPTSANSNVRGIT